MSDLSSLRAGDEFIAPIGFGSDTRTATVLAVGRAWITDDRMCRYRIDDGRSEKHTTMFRYAMTKADYAQHVKDEENRDVLRRWDMHSARRTLTSPQLRQVAALLAEFELPPVPQPEDPGAVVRVRVSIEPSWTHDHYTEVFEVTEGDIAARPASQSREDMITELAEDVVNNVCSWGAMEVDGDAEDE